MPATVSRPSAANPADAHAADLADDQARRHGLGPRAERERRALRSLTNACRRS